MRQRRKRTSAPCTFEPLEHRYVLSSANSFDHSHNTAEESAVAAGLLATSEVINTPATVTSPTTSDLNGEIISTGGDNPTLNIFFGDTNDGNWDQLINLGIVGQGPFSTSVTGLTPGTTYYYRARASNLFGSSYAPTIESFVTTTIQPPTVITLDPVLVGSTIANLQGSVTDTGFDDPTVSVYWGDNDGGTSSNNWDQQINLGVRASGTFVTSLTGLIPEADYFYRVFASNSGGSSWASETKTFTTSEPTVGDIVISEFMAENSGFLLDGAGNSPDWIELQNRDIEPVDLARWYLTDDPDNLDKWPFPSVLLQPAGSAGDTDFLVVFASGKNSVDFVDSGGNLHTNFQLNAKGDYLALVDPTGKITSEFNLGGNDFPQQKRNISYGLGSAAATAKLVLTGATADIVIPDANFDSTIGNNWTGGNETSFLGNGGLNGWTQGPTGIGYSQNSGGIPLLNHWKFDETSGSVAADSVGNLDLSLKNFPSNDSQWNTASPLGDGRGLEFDGANDYASNLDEPFDSDREHTFTVWARHDDSSFVPPNLQRWISWGGGGLPRYFIGPNNKVDLGIGSITVNFGSNASLPQQGIWQHWALVRNTQSVQLYVDSQLVATISRSLQGQISTAGELRVGRQFDPDLEFFDGALADMAIFDGPLTQQQIQTVMNSGAEAVGSTLGNLIQTDITSQMKNVNASAYIRIPFEVTEIPSLSNLTLKMKYDDGFVAYLDGHEIARRNAPAAVAWNSTATADQPTESAVVFENIDVSSSANSLTLGNHVLAIHGLNRGASNNGFLVLPELVGTDQLGIETLYFPSPTPGTSNSGGLYGFVEDTSFSVDRGFYDTPLNVVITSPTPGSTIIYTTDGSEPTLTNGTSVPATNSSSVPNAIVNVSTTTTLRAAAFKDSHLPTNIDTQTYIFLDDVVDQNGAGFPSSWGPKTADYALDQDLIGPGKTHENTIRDDLQAVATVSIVMDVDDLFGPSGIYSNTQSRGISWERPASFELIDPAGGPEIQVNAGIRIHGGGSRGSWMPKHSLRVYFKGEYGSPTLQFPLFPNSNVEVFDVLILDARYNQSWLWAHHSVPDGPTTGAGRQYAQYVRDQWAWDTMEAMGYVSPNARPVYVYLNGLFWGLHIVHERADAGFAAAEFGGNKEEYDAIKGAWPTGGFQVNSGDGVAFTAMMNIVNDSGRSGDEKFGDVQEYLDMDHFIDYILLQIYAGNTDLRERNWWATRRREPSGQFHFYPWDSEYMLLQITDDVSNFNYTDSPWRLHQRLRSSPEYRQKFADHVQRHLHNDGLLTPAAVEARFMARTAEIDRAIVGESVRWGDHRLDNRNDGTTTGPVSTYTRNNQWLTEQNRLLTTIFPQRTDVTLNQLINDDLYPSFDAPQFRIDGTLHHGGSIAVGAQLSMVDPNSPDVGSIYYTTDGTDPRASGGAVSGSAQAYAGSLPVDESLSVKARLFTGSQWSALSNAVFTVTAADATNLVVNEIMYHPAAPSDAEITAGYTDADDFEFIEFQNVSDNVISLADVAFDSGSPVTFNFNDGKVQTLDAGEHLLVVHNQTAFEFRYGSGISEKIAGQYSGGMNNGGERFTLLDASKATIQSFSFDDTAPWPISPDGHGFSLILIDSTSNPDPANADHWRGSGSRHGSPGNADVMTQSEIRINEVLTHTDAPSVDQIELYNPNVGSVDVGGWFLTDNRNLPTRYVIPAGTTIAGGGYFTFLEDDDADPLTAPPANYFGGSFSLSSLGEIGLPAFRRWYQPDRV